MIIANMSVNIRLGVKIPYKQNDIEGQQYLNEIVELFKLLPLSGLIMDYLEDSMSPDDINNIYITVDTMGSNETVLAN